MGGSVVVVVVVVAVVTVAPAGGPGLVTGSVAASAPAPHAAATRDSDMRRKRVLTSKGGRLPAYNFDGLGVNL